jgi:hypothetical protein
LFTVNCKYCTYKTVKPLKVLRIWEDTLRIAMVVLNEQEHGSLWHCRVTLTLSWQRFRVNWKCHSWSDSETVAVWFNCQSASDLLSV